MRYLLPILILFLLAGIVFYYTLGNKGSKDQTNSTPTEVVSNTNNSTNSNRQTNTTNNNNYNPKDGKHLLAFYNVENLFDTVDDPKTKDDEFLPNADKKWNQERYIKKLDDLNKVLSSWGEMPDILGVCEVENEKVLKDLIKRAPTNGKEMGIVHQNSNDMRGIDVALIYNKTVFEFISKKMLNVQLPAPYQHETTRDILYVKGNWISSNETIHIFVNHWSSRRGGLKDSEPKRLACAKVVRKQIDEIYKNEKDPKIIVMGDFNDEPNNNSIKEVLQAKLENKSITHDQLYNLSSHLSDEGKGTYNYRGNWNVLDQIIVSGNFIDDKKGLYAAPNSAEVQIEQWMTYNDPKYGPRPNKTYGGPNYYGGYSDHYPTYLLMYE